MAAPVARLAHADAFRLLTSLGVRGPPLIPTSPMMPDRTPVSPTPTVTSRMISSARSSAVRWSMSGGWEPLAYQPDPMTMLTPVTVAT